MALWHRQHLRRTGWAPQTHFPDQPTTCTNDQPTIPSRACAHNLSISTHTNAYTVTQTHTQTHAYSHTHIHTHTFPGSRSLPSSWSANCCNVKPRHSNTPCSRYCANTCRTGTSGGSWFIQYSGTVAVRHEPPRRDLSRWGGMGPPSLTKAPPPSCSLHPPPSKMHQRFQHSTLGWHSTL